MFVCSCDLWFCPFLLKLALLLQSEEVSLENWIMSLPHPRLAVSFVIRTLSRGVESLFWAVEVGYLASRT